MSVSPEDAAKTLRDVERAQARSSILYRYQMSTPYWIMWGILLIAGYTLEQLFPMQWFVVWGVVDSIGFSIGLSGYFSPRSGRAEIAWRPLTLTAVVFLVCYAIGYRAAGLYPRYANVVFWGTTALGIGASLVIARIAGRAVPGGWRMWAIFAAVWLSYTGLFARLSPLPERAAEASAPLILATVFVLWGINAGARYVVVGLVIAALTLAVYFTIHEHFALWIAAVLCGSLVLAGLWMRRV